MRSKVLILCLLLGVAWCGAARAAILPLTLTVIADGSVTVFDGLQGSVDGDIFSGQFNFANDDFSLDWFVRGSTDPFMAVGLGVTDFGAPSTFSFLFSMPVAPLSCTTTAGSVGGSITDANGNNATITDVGVPIYTAILDSLSFTTLLNPIYSLSTTTPYSTATIPATSFGLPGVTYPGPAVTTNMGLDLTFGLSGGGDTAAMTANFVVNPCVPEPASMMLVAIGASLLAGRALRRRTLVH